MKKRIEFITTPLGDLHIKGRRVFVTQKIVFGGIKNPYAKLESRRYHFENGDDVLLDLGGKPQSGILNFEK